MLQCSPVLLKELEVGVGGESVDELPEVPDGAVQEVEDQRRPCSDVALVIDGGLRSARLAQSRPTGPATMSYCFIQLALAP